MVEAVELFKLNITSMSYLYEVFEHLQLLWMGVWMHILSVTTTDDSPDLGELAKSLGDASVQTIPVPQSPNLMNSARLHKVFQNFVVPWKIHIIKI
jgi:hypothetical protein